jgi:signal transduction histidine kinase
MQRRLAEIGGTFEIVGRPAGGTLVRMRVAADTSKSANL